MRLFEASGLGLCLLAGGVAIALLGPPAPSRSRHPQFGRRPHPIAHPSPVLSWGLDRVRPALVYAPVPTLEARRGTWTFYKRGLATWYEAEGKTAMGEVIQPDPLDGIAAVDRTARHLLGRWLLLAWGGEERQVYCGDLCGRCAEYGVAVDLSSGFHRRTFGQGATPMVDVYFWQPLEQMRDDSF